MSFFRWENETTLILTVRAVPGSRKTEFGEVINDVLKVFVKAQPTDNEANEALIKFLSKEFKTPQSRNRIISGATGRNKVIEVGEPRMLPELINIS
jgi:uncharacterized protein (TIGR00251 family)